jgi:protein-S-isoprenylcysteine O-methyltransferase Ste14
VRRLTTAAVGSAVFFVLAPGIVAGLVPWLISGWDVRWPISGFGVVVMALGSALLAVAIVVLIRNFIRFVVEGRGTPSPVLQTERLVVGGDYRYVRNPMYLAVISAILGQAMIFGSLALVLYPLWSGRSWRRLSGGTRSRCFRTATVRNTDAIGEGSEPGCRG